MKARWLGMVLAAGLFTSAAMATNINISVQQPNGTNAITVHPGDTVNYKIIGTLSDNVNDGLALIGLSLDFDLASPGGDLAPAGTPIGAITCGNPMPAFVIPNGITNPAGFGGTVIGGNLIQIGGGQNTIKNTAGNAPFPIGTVLTGVAQPGGCGPATIATGSLTIPLGTAPGTYHLNAFDVFANVIKDGETGEVFYATEAAGIGTVTNLTADVPPGGANLVSSIPAFTAHGITTVPAMGTLWRSAGNVVRLTFDGAVALPTAGQVLIQEMLAGGVAGPDLSASFGFALGSGNTVLRIHDGLTATPTANLGHRKWYVIRNTGGWAGVANFEAQFPSQVGDATGDNRVVNLDVSTVNAGVPCLSGCGDANRLDVNGDQRVTNVDVSLANSSVSSFAVPKPSGW